MKTKINREYILRLHAIHKRIMDAARDLQVALLKSAENGWPVTPEVARWANDLDSLVGHMEKIFSETLTGEVNREEAQMITIRREWNDWRKIAKAPLAALSGFHWSDSSGRVAKQSPQFHIHAYVSCGDLIGDIGHLCSHGQWPHSIEVVIVKTDNDNLDREVMNLISDLAGQKPSKKNPVERVPNYRPKKYTAPDLKCAGVTILDKSRPRLQCETCDHVWEPKLLHNRLVGDVRLAPGYWHCPNGCNRPE